LASELYESESKMDWTLNAMTPADWSQVRAIYLEGLATGNATFQTEAPSWEAWDAGHLPNCRLVVRRGEDVIGWAALSLGSARPCYAGVAEVSVYVAASARGQAVGDALMRTLVETSEAHGIWTLWSSIFPENVASIRLHLRHGFREVGRRERIAQLQSVWRDTVVLERRSVVVGL
jgi:L-amino acid N-acyltransferase YncA